MQSRTSRQHRGRYAEVLEKALAPHLGTDVEELGPRGIGRIGDVGSAFGEPPDEKAVNRAKAQLTRRGPARNAVAREQPFELGAGEIGIDQQAGDVDEVRLHAIGAHLLAPGGGSAVLPDDGVAETRAGVRVPKEGGFPLVGDADGGDRRRFDAASRDGLLPCGQGRRPQRFGILLHPGILGIHPLEGALRGTDLAAPLVEHDCARARCALIDGEYVRHEFLRQSRAPRRTLAAYQQGYQPIAAVSALVANSLSPASFPLAEPVDSPVQSVWSFAPENAQYIQRNTQDLAPNFHMRKMLQWDLNLRMLGLRNSRRPIYWGWEPARDRRNKGSAKRLRHS